MEDLEAIDTALGALEENGVDADADDLEGSVEVLGGLVESAENAEEDGELDADGLEAKGELEDASAALQRLSDGDGDADDVAQADEVLKMVGQTIQQELIKHMLGGAAP